MGRKKGDTPWNKGIKTGPLEVKHRELISKKLKEAYKKGRTGFKRGHKPWNKGIHWNPPNKEGLEIGRGYFKGQMIKRNYGNIHYWVRKTKGKAEKCEHCGTSKGRIEWANIDHKYRQKIDDYISLCKSCHSRYDKGGDEK